LAETGPPVRGWRRGLALFLVAVGVAVTSPLPLIGVPFFMLAFALGTKRLSVTVLAMLCVVLVFGSSARGGLWYFERGWAIVLGGWFTAVTLWRPGTTFLSRALAATAGSYAISAVVIAVQAGGWARLDWAVGQSLSEGVSLALEGMRGLTENGPSQALVESVMAATEQQRALFPALLGLSSVAALGASWWLYVRLVWDSDRALRALREFRFNDHLVWFFIAGLALLVLGLGEAAQRAGTNAVVFMGVLYALRGAAVVIFLTGGLSIVGTLLLVVGLLLAGPLVIGSAVIIGLGDTWLDVRTHVEQSTGNSD